EHVLHQVVARLIHVGIDLVGDQNRRLPGETHSNVAADLSDPYVPALKAQRRSPQPQVVALMDRAADFLQSKILTTAEVEEAAHRRISILAPEQKGFDRQSHRVPSDNVGRIPTLSDQRTHYRVFVADQYKVDRIARSCAGAVCGAAG